MKLLFFTVAMLLVLSCSKDKGSECGLNPPDWLQGSWADGNGLVEWTITDDNLTKTSLTIGLDFCEEITGPTNGCNCKQWIEEVKSGTQYRIRLDTDLGVSFEQADFIKVSDNSITEDNIVFTRQ